MTLSVQVWSDLACPWCYLGKRRLEAALAEFKARDAVHVTWRAFELDRTAPAAYPASPSYAQRLATKYRLPPARGEQMLSEMTARGKQEQVVFDFARIAASNTFAAHQAIQYARQHADARVQGALVDRLFRAYFSEGRLLSDAETLVELATEVGLDGSALRLALEAETFAADVRRDEAQAAELGVTGVPFFVVGRYAVEGAQPAASLLQVLNRAFDETSTASPEIAPNLGTTEQCGPEVCE